MCMPISLPSPRHRRCARTVHAARAQRFKELHAARAQKKEVDPERQAKREAYRRQQEEKKEEYAGVREKRAEWDREMDKTEEGRKYKKQVKRREDYDNLFLALN